MRGIHPRDPQKHLPGAEIPVLPSSVQPPQTLKTHEVAKEITLAPSTKDTGMPQTVRELSPEHQLSVAKAALKSDAVPDSAAGFIDTSHLNLTQRTELTKYILMETPQHLTKTFKSLNLPPQQWSLLIQAAVAKTDRDLVFSNLLEAVCDTWLRSRMKRGIS